MIFLVGQGTNVLIDNCTSSGDVTNNGGGGIVGRYVGCVGGYVTINN